MIVVAGEALFDVFVGDDTREGVAMEARIGGSPLNVAIGLARLQQPAAFLGAIGLGKFGDRLMQALQAEGVSAALVQRVAAPTTLGLVAVDARGVPEYGFYGDGAADRRLAKTSLALVDGLQAFHLGSYSSVAGETAETLENCVLSLPSECVVSFDPNVRVNVVPDLSVWRQRLAWMMPRTQLLKISEEDLELLFPGRSLVGFLNECSASGVAVAIVTRGSEGAIGQCAAGQVSVPVSRSTALVDTVGAGDSYQAALLTWLAEHDVMSAKGLASLSRDALRSAMTFAAEAAAITCSRRGADLPRRSDLA